jgi:Immunity protein 53
MTRNTLLELQHWFTAHCDGNREHHHGISIETTDNPGWWVKIALQDTELAEQSFTTVAENVDPNGFPLGPHWLMCRLQDGRWHGAGDETRLEQILSIFLAWAAA